MSLSFVMLFAAFVPVSASAQVGRNIREELRRAANCYQFFGNNERALHNCLRRNNVGALQADTYSLLEGAQREGDYANARAQIYKMRRDGGVPVFGGPRMGDGRTGPVTRAILGGAIGSAIGYVIGTDARSSAIGAGAGAVIGLMIGRNRNGGGSSNNEQILLRNSFRSARVRVYEGSKLIEVLQPMETERKKVRSDARIWAEAEMRDPSTGAPIIVRLDANGRGMRPLGDGAGVEFYNPIY
ncbi:MAG: glycine zipper family protein [bacterium]|nr:glycine zipper family protein [bacterium]